MTPITPLPTLPESPLPPSAATERRPSLGNLRTTFRSHAGIPLTIRAVTPEPSEGRASGVAGPDPSSSGLSNAQVVRNFGSMSPQSSPRSIPGGGALSNSGSSRRQGMVFSDALASSFDSASSSPPPRHRPRTHTMDGATAFRQQLAPNTGLDTRHRMGSFSSSGSLPLQDELRGPPLQPPSRESVGYPSVAQPKPLPLDLHISITPRDKKTTSRRLIKRSSSRPTSPLVSPPPSVDSLPLPIPTEDANKVLLLMKTLCGRMRGEIEYQSEPGGPWTRGMCYIEEEKGSLMFDSGENGPFHVALVPELGGCRVVPANRPDKGGCCLELATAQGSPAVVLRPYVADEFDLWLAALLCWQQLRPGLVKPSPNGRVGNGTPTSDQPEPRRRASTVKSREATIIKVGKVMLWDKGMATSPRAIVKRPSTRDLRSSQSSWRRVSCILQGNGEFKLMTENDVTILAVIELSQLARCAVQQLDKSVLDEEYCIAVFPIYSPSSTQLSIFRPVYIALDSRVSFEVWFVLLRAFAVPDVYGLDPTADNQLYEIANLDVEPYGEIFRVEKALSLRLTEAKIKSRSTADPGGYVPERHGKNDDPLLGNYLAEVILDGEVRARTTTKSDTKNPFWREEYDFTELPSHLPFLSVVLKRVDGNLDTFSHQLQASLGLPKTGNLTEVLCGSVDIPLTTMERGRDYEQWFPIHNDKQQSIGSMLARVQHEEVVVLLASEYQPLSELLHKFSAGLTAQIAQVLPGNLRRVSEIFLNIFQVSGSSTEWLMALVEDEIDGIGNQTTMKKMRFSRRLKSNESTESATDRELLVRDMGRSLAGEANLLFRGNSLLTQALEFHMRRLGKEYLEEVLSDKIFEINEINPDCEVDPSRLQAGEDIHKHWDQLMQLTNEVWACISSSAHRFPTELRQILKYIRAVAEDRYGDFLRTVAYTSVSGFLFLRFICPAILNPKLFGLLRDHPRPRAQRTLTLIAKGLQALANLSSIGKKETWMDPMNRFLTGHRQSVKDFIDSVCAIPAERANVALPASYSTPIAILSRLSPIAREGFPSLPYLVDHARNFAALARLWMDANPLTQSESHLYDGELLQFHTACVALQRRAAACLSRLEVLRAAAASSRARGGATSGTATPDGASSAALLDHAALLDTINVSYGGSAVWMDAEGPPPGSSGSEMDGNGGGGGGGSGTGSNGNLRDRWGRQASAGSEGSSLSGLSSGTTATMRSLRNGRHARKFLSGFMGRKSAGRTASPDASVVSSPVVPTREKDSDRDRDRDRGKEKEKDSAAGDRDKDAALPDGGSVRGGTGDFAFGESWGSGTLSLGSVRGDVQLTRYPQ